MAFSWYFPYHISARGPELGHQYEHWFADAFEVNRFLVANHRPHRRKVTTFANALAASDLPDEMRFCWGAQLSTLTKSTWWLRDGGFSVFEGLGCCGFETVDVTYQGSAPILALFPELQKNQMELTARFQRSNGQLPHNFAPDFNTPDRGWGRVDLNPQFIMIVCRDYLWTGDKQYLARMWPHVQRALAYMASLDEDGDGLPEKETGLNTYDQWAFQGTPSYIGSLWLGAYAAAKRMARDMGDQAASRKMEGLLARARPSFDKKLWNGSYYNLWFYNGVSDPCCMTDQISGIWFSSLAGLESALPTDRVRQVLEKVFRENFDPEQGLLNSSYPQGATPQFPAYMNAQATANWTGIEYASASFFLEYGMTREALAIVQAINRRYARAGRWWNHVECGNHYYRAMASWCTLVAATGFKPDQAAGRLQVAPHFAKLNAPWFSAQAFGVLAYAPQKLTLSCMAGEMEFQTLVTPVRAPKVRLNNRVLSGRVAREADLWRIDFNQKVTMTPESKLTIVG
ncbi:MAG: GH116 family glycosyl hydrolase [Acidobacteriota bacterium]